MASERRKGIERVRPRDAGKAAALERWLRKMEQDYADRILPVDARVADIWGKISAIRTIPAIDALLAATAMRFDLTLATRNVSEVDGLGVSLFNPFDWRETGTT
ncbi:MAG: PIN domain-containing protein [Defluviicoccus sp.]|nr:PIN domain-containing protein [Defluviicoccus sp.]